jgi:hypothetical protein
MMPGPKRQHERSPRSYDRQPGNRTPSQAILIVCEGEKTEPNYFNALRSYIKLTTVQVEIKPRGGAPMKITFAWQSQTLPLNIGIFCTSRTLPDPLKTAMK